jgi:hypothetical protein
MPESAMATASIVSRAERNPVMVTCLEFIRVVVSEISVEQNPYSSKGSRFCGLSMHSSGRPGLWKQAPSHGEIGIL